MKLPHHENHSNSASDALLVANAKKDMKHFEVLYRKYYSQIFRFVHKRVANTDQVNDITSQVFLKAMVNLNKYQDKGFPFSSWLYRIALSELGNLFRVESVQRALKVEWALSAELFSDLDTDQENHTVSELGSALNELNEEHLAMVEMRYFEKVKLKDIAHIMELSESNAKVKMHRILNKLRKQLGED
ncbi:MAG: RNA polymerase sigma factor [Flavobacteriales bacterium]